MHSFLASEDALDALLAGFHDGSWPGKAFTHGAHLAVAACYILDGESALDRLRAAIPRYNESQGNSNTADGGYHETLTCFWYHVVRTYIASLPDGLSRIEITAKVVEEYNGQRDLHRRYYDFDVIKSREARARWVPPSGIFGESSRI